MDIVVGKKYQSKDWLKRYAKVKYVGDQFVIYERIGYPQGTSTEASLHISEFHNTFKEVPPWKPEVGEKARYTGPTYTSGIVTVVHIEGNCAWVRSSERSIGFVSMLYSLDEPSKD